MKQILLFLLVCASGAMAQAATRSAGGENHWPQKHFNNHQKDCPRILLDGGKPGPRWAAFLWKVRSYY